MNQLSGGSPISSLGLDSLGRISRGPEKESKDPRSLVVAR